MSNKVTGVRPFLGPRRLVALLHAAHLLSLHSTPQKPMMEIVFREHANARAGQKFLSLFPGLGYAAGYKGAPSSPCHSIAAPC